MLQAQILCHLRSIAAHRDHFVRRLSVCVSVCLSVCPCFCPVVLCFAGDTCIPRNGATMFIIIIVIMLKPATIKIRKVEFWNRVIISLLFFFLCFPLYHVFNLKYILYYVKDLNLAGLNISSFKQCLSLHFCPVQFSILNQNQNKSTCYLFRFLWSCMLIRQSIGRSMSVTRHYSAMLPKITLGYLREIIPFIDNYATCI